MERKENERLEETRRREKETKMREDELRSKAINREEKRLEAEEMKQIQGSKEAEARRFRDHVVQTPSFEENNDLEVYLETVEESYQQVYLLRQSGHSI